MRNYSTFKPLFVTGCVCLLAGLAGIYFYSEAMNIGRAAIIAILVGIGVTLFGFSFFFFPTRNR